MVVVGEWVVCLCVLVVGYLCNVLSALDVDAGDQLMQLSARLADRGVNVNNPKAVFKTLS